MSIEMRKERDGRIRPNWYGRYELNGRRHTLNLEIRITGKPPQSLRHLGDPAFERSRVTAQLKLDQIVEEARKKSGGLHLVERIYELKTGEQIKSIALKELADEWEYLPRTRDPSAAYIKQNRSKLERFVRFVKARSKGVHEVGQVNKNLAKAYMLAERKRGVSPKTWNDALKLLRTTFASLLPEGAPNPFRGIKSREAETVFRKPFSPEDLQLIVDAAQEDEFIRPIIITGICTAMRRGDCCLLKWADVDMMDAFITVKTSKTGQTVSIPIFPLLHEELAGRVQTGKYVFPQQAAMFEENPSGISWRVKKILAQAFSEPEADEDLPLLSPQETRAKAHAYLDTLVETSRTVKMRTTLDCYLDDLKGTELFEKSGVSKGSLSLYLNDIEIGAGCQIIRQRNGKSTGKRSVTALVRGDSGNLQLDREGGLRRASIRDFHSFRVTWVTLALTAGVPLELVQRVTGHKTTDIVLKHYFQPRREDFRKALHSAMPELLTQDREGLQAEPPIEYEIDPGPSEKLGEALEMLEGVNSLKYNKKIKEAMQLIASAKGWYDSTVLREQ